VAVEALEDGSIAGDDVADDALQDGLQVGEVAHGRAGADDSRRITIHQIEIEIEIHEFWLDCSVGLSPFLVRVLSSVGTSPGIESAGFDYFGHFCGR
jgi:hypothetical protein